MFSINYRDSRPIYEQIKGEFRRLILTGAMPAGTRLPSIRELAAELAINPNTIQRAYRELETEGVILSIAGKGSFAAEQPQTDEPGCEQLLERFRLDARELTRYGFSAGELHTLLEDCCKEDSSGND